MATLASYNQVFYAQEALIHLRKVLGMAARVHRGYELERNATFNRGEYITISTPSTFTAQDAPGSNQSLTAQSTSLRLTQWKEVRYPITDKEQAFTGEQIFAIHIEPAAYAIADVVDQSLCALYKDVPWLYDYGASTDHTVITGLSNVLFQNGVPLDNPAMLHLQVDGALRTSFLNSTTFHSAQVAGAAAAGPLLRGTLGERFGMEVYANQNAALYAAHTPGTAAGGGDTAGAVNGAHAAGVTALVVASFTGSETVLAGDTFVIAGHTQRYAAISTTTFSTGAGTINFTPPLAVALSGSEVVTIGAQTATAHTQQLAYHRNAFALALAPLPDNLPGVEAFTAVDPVSGLAVRARRYTDGDNSQVIQVIDALYGVKTLDGNLAVRGWT